MNAKDLVEAYNSKYKKSVVQETVTPKLSNSDLKAKAIIESLIENRFAVDAPTTKDAVCEINKLAVLNTVVSRKIFELFDDVTTACSIDDLGNITVDFDYLKRRY